MCIIFIYRHSEAIQCLAYNPITMHLVSCAVTDFAFWSMDVKAVQKYRLSGRITCCAWSSNGQHLAIGLASGVVSIRDKVCVLLKFHIFGVFLKMTKLSEIWEYVNSIHNSKGATSLGRKIFRKYIFALFCQGK